MELLNRMVLTTLPLVPTPIMRRLALRYIAGETLDSALQELADLGSRGYPGIIDMLGERVATDSEACGVVDEYLKAAKAVTDRSLEAYVSVKPTHVGLHLSEDRCVELYTRLAEGCRDLGTFLRVEMEEAETVDGTLRVFEALRTRFDNVGIVLQSRLFRTLDDIEALADGPLDVRVVKGIYLEPASIAHTEPEPIRDAFLAMVEALARRGARMRLATHDAGLADRCIDILGRHETPPEMWELEVLLGVQESLWKHWRSAGHTVRVYVPYGPEWRAYSLRRMRKNPEILRHVMRNTLGLR
jgi:proline dehydrogenase